MDADQNTANQFGKQAPYFEDSRTTRFYFNKPQDEPNGILRILVFDSCRDNPFKSAIVEDWQVEAKNDPGIQPTAPNVPTKHLGVSICAAGWNVQAAAECGRPRCADLQEAASTRINRERCASAASNGGAFYTLYHAASPITRTRTRPGASRTVPLLTTISTSCPSAVRHRSGRSPEKPTSRPFISADTFG
jgi:hypothetical protein